MRVLEQSGEPSGLLEAWDGADLAVVVDALPGRDAGHRAVLRRDRRAAPAGLGGASTHALGLAEAIELGRALGRLPARLTVYAIEGQAFEPGAAPGHRSPRRSRKSPSARWRISPAVRRGY